MLLCRVLGGNAKLCQAQDGRSSSAFSSLQTYQDPCSPTYQPMLAPATAPALAPYLAPGDPATNIWKKQDLPSLSVSSEPSECVTQLRLPLLDHMVVMQQQT